MPIKIEHSAKCAYIKYEKTGIQRSENQLLELATLHAHDKYVKVIFSRYKLCIFLSNLTSSLGRLR